MGEMSIQRRWYFPFSNIGRGSREIRENLSALEKFAETYHNPQSDFRFSAYF